MSAKRHERTFARRCAIQALYTSEIQNLAPSAVLDQGLCLVEGDEVLNDYAVMLMRGVEEHCDAIDDRLRSVSENWAVERMPIVDRMILRVAVFEMVYCDQVPVSVSINEAVELAKGFGGEDESPRFVNGVLGQIARTLELESAPAPLGDGATAGEVHEALARLLQGSEVPTAVAEGVSATAAAAASAAAEEALAAAAQGAPVPAAEASSAPAEGGAAPTAASTDESEA